MVRFAAIAIAFAPLVLACGAHQGSIASGDDASTGGDDGSVRDAELPPLDGVVLADSVGDDTSGGKTCEGLPDGTPCGAGDACNDPPACQGGVCKPPQPKADGTVCAVAPDACHTDGTCKSGSCGAIGTRPEGYNWQSNDDTARCCSGKPLHTNTDSDCGVCGIQCNKSNGESCQILGGHWFCRGCISSSACWSHCCSLSFNPSSCAASDCAGHCSAQYCPQGTHCVDGQGVSSDYCAY
jgi:hypothetical protein